jgi:hypothetical protein
MAATPSILFAGKQAATQKNMQNKNTLIIFDTDIFTASG